MEEGYRWVVDVDLEKFFDRVNHDVLMGRLAKRITDKRILRLIRRYLQAGILADGVVSPRTEGSPQGSRLSPLLSNILLDELHRDGEAWPQVRALCGRLQCLLQISTRRRTRAGITHPLPINATEVSRQPREERGRQTVETQLSELHCHLASPAQAQGCSLGGTRARVI